MRTLLLLVLVCLCPNVATLSTTRRARSWLVPQGVKFGDLQRLELLHQQEERTCHKNGGFVKVATMAVGLNFADVFTVLGYYKAANVARQQDGNNNNKPQLDDFCPGLEFSGVVVETDKSTTDFCKGDRVYGFTKFGAYSDVVIVPSNQLQKLPANWSHEEGAGFLVNALTAWYGLVTVANMPLCTANDGIRKKKPFVVVAHSASGGVGLWAIEIAARRGAIVVGVVGNADKMSIFYQRIQRHCPNAQCIVRSSNPKQFANDLCQAIIQARISSLGGSTNDVPQELRENMDNIQPLDVAQTGWGADIVMESYGGKYFQPSLDIINAGGSMATYGSTSYNGSGKGSQIPFLPLAWKFLSRPRIDPGILSSRNVRVGGFNLIFLTENNQQLSQALEDCVACLSNNGQGDSTSNLAKVTPPLIGEVHDFGTGAADALQALRSGNTVGKVILLNSDNPLLVQR